MYGHRGAIIMTCGLSMQGFVAVALIQPVERHMKKEPKKAVTDGKISNSHVMYLERHVNLPKSVKLAQSIQTNVHCLGFNIN